MQTNLESCEECKIGYGNESSTKTCIACEASCESCDGSGKICYLCKQYFKVNPINNKCESCNITNCSYCESSNLCSNCLSGY